MTRLCPSCSTLMSHEAAMDPDFVKHLDEYLCLIDRTVFKQESVENFFFFFTANVACGCKKKSPLWPLFYPLF